MAAQSFIINCLNPILDLESKGMVLRRQCGPKSVAIKNSLSVWVSVSLMDAIAVTNAGAISLKIFC